MIRSHLRVAATVISYVCAAAWIAASHASVSADDHANATGLASQRTAAVAVKAPALDPVAELARAHVEAERLIAIDAAGRRIEFSVAPALQARVERILRDYRVPHAALVAIEPTTGRVLAYVNHSSVDAEVADIARDPMPPAASVFKLITASALVDAGVKPDSKLCYGGGSSRLELVDLADNKRRDGACASLTEALGNSINAIFAKLADRHLDVATLRRYVSSFGFGQKLGFVPAVPASPFDIPSERLEFARTSAGFWHVHMSPLHAALIAATFANDGQMPAATLVDRVISTDGKLLPAPRSAAPRTVLPAATARSVAAMMLRTVQSGTSRGAFYDARGRALLPGISVAGKTGSLNGSDPFRAYSWWVGFAPADKPRIALAALIVNSPQWRIKSSFLAREALHAYLIATPPPPLVTARGPAKTKVSARCAAAESCERR